MSNLLAIEWLKLKKYRTFRILIGFFIVLLPLWNYGINHGFLKIGGTKDGINIIDRAYTFAQVWKNIGWWASLFVVFITILTIIITTNEYSFKTQRQNIIDGWTRLQAYHAKWIVVIVFAAATTLYVFLTGVLFGIANGDAANFPGNMTSLFYVFVLSLNYYSFGLLIGYFFKRSGISIGIFFLYFMIIEQIGKEFINWATKTHIGNLMPLQASDELLPFPLIEFAREMVQDPNRIPAWGYVTASFAWVILYYLTARYRLLKSDW